MGELISKKQAATAFIDGEDVEFLDKTGQWRTMLDNTILKVFLDHTEFRLKPRTITINGVELPKPLTAVFNTTHKTSVELDFETEQDAINFAKIFSNNFIEFV